MERSGTASLRNDLSEKISHTRIPGRAFYLERIANAKVLERHELCLRNSCPTML
jgi:hypothetical protein